MPPFSVEAVILRTSEFSERDLLVSFYAEVMGKARGVAKGAKASRRRFGANLDLLSHVMIKGFEKNSHHLVRIDSVDLLEHFGTFREDLDCFARACYIAEWSEGCIPERQPIQGLMELLLWTTRKISRKEANQGILRFFELRSLSLVGYGPRLDSCARCGGDAEGLTRIEVDIPSGGVVCQRCAQGTGFTISRGTLLSLREALETPLERLHRIRLSGPSEVEAGELLKAFYAYHVGAKIRSWAFLKSR